MSRYFVKSILFGVLFCGVFSFGESTGKSQGYVGLSIDTHAGKGLTYTRWSNSTGWSLRLLPYLNIDQKKDQEAMALELGGQYMIAFGKKPYAFGKLFGTGESLKLRPYTYLGVSTGYGQLRNDSPDDLPVFLSGSDAIYDNRDWYMIYGGSVSAGVGLQLELYIASIYFQFGYGGGGYKVEEIGKNYEYTFGSDKRTSTPIDDRYWIFKTDLSGGVGASIAF